MISKKCKYALKALLYISKNSGGKAILTSSIAQDENIPRKFLESILRSLRNNQILYSKRGKEGGFLLLRDPKEIYIVEIMRIMDGPVAMLPCVSLTGYQACEECYEKNWAIKGMFETIRDKTLEVLGGTSLHDLNLKWWWDHHLYIDSFRVYAKSCSDHSRRVVHCMHWQPLLFLKWHPWWFVRGHNLTLTHSLF